MAKQLDDIRFEIICYLNNAGCPDARKLLEQYDKALKREEPIKYKHIGMFQVPLDLYNACKSVVPPEILNRLEQKINHILMSEPDINKILKFRNSIPEQYQDLYNEWSNVTTQEAKSHYNGYGNP